MWKFNRQVPKVPANTLLRVQADAPFLLHWTNDEWQTSTDTKSTPTALSINFADIHVSEQSAPIRFTFLWLNENRWEGKDYKVEVEVRQP